MGAEEHLCEGVCSRTMKYAEQVALINEHNIAQHKDVDNFHNNHFFY